MDFSVEVALEGERLSADECRQLIAAKEGLVLLKGKWIEIDGDRLNQVLEHWKRIEKGEDGVSFLEGMRLLAGLGHGKYGDPLAQPESREWSQVVPGEWLRKTLGAMRDPSVIEGFDPERDLQAPLRGYQREGVRWLWFMARLGLGACLADDMGLGKTIQTLALLLQLKRETAGAQSSYPHCSLRRPHCWPTGKTRSHDSLQRWSVFFAHPSESLPQTLKEVVADPARTLVRKRSGDNDLRFADAVTIGAANRLAARGARRGAGHQKSGVPPDIGSQGAKGAGTDCADWYAGREPGGRSLVAV